ncbi:ribonuclease E/G [Sporolactobacillus spathodeae]|uniref:Ribonuclease G n=1 Tax=Sporolactobacillus spathodeae TaxID=1465502 RepID=A0ABS2Q6L2_9BACL|nr:ribonuclease G [Sporolactobacillus spathodeae]
MDADEWRVIIDGRQSGLTRAALLQNGELLSFYLQASENRLQTGDIFYAEVTEERLAAAGWFLTLGDGTSAFLPRDKALHPDQMRKRSHLIVQVEKMPGRGKGAQLTEQIQIAGQGLVFLPFSHYSAASRAIEEPLRTSLRHSAAAWCVGEEGVIVRTEAQLLDEITLQNEFDRLRKRWNTIYERYQKMEKPGLVERPFTFLTSILNENHWPKSCTVYCGSTCDCESLVTAIRWVREETGDLFEKYGLEKNYQDALRRMVPLKAGGSLVIDSGEALTAIDVNSGTRHIRDDWEARALQINCEAATEIARQIRLRGIGGMIVIDFLRLAEEDDRKKVADALRAGFARDTETVKFFGFTAMGLYEITRKRQRYSLQDYQRDKENNTD